MSRRRGNLYENSFCEFAEELGFATFCARGSRGPVDVVCFNEDEGPAPTLVVQVGTTNKAIARTLDELYAARRPYGSLALVARRHRAANRRISWTFHTAAGKYHSLQEAIESRERA